MGDEPEGVPPSEDWDDARLSVEALGVEPLESERAHSRRARAFRALGGMLRAQPALARAAGLALLAALTLAIAVTALPDTSGFAFQLHSSATRAAPTSTTHTPVGDASPSPTPAPTVTWGQGWVRAGPIEAQRIVFAPSAPDVAYTCGAPSLVSLAQPVPILVEVSRDGAHAWQPAPTPALGVECDLTVDPLDAQDLVLAALPPPTNQSFGFTGGPWDVALYRSLDGGVTWRPWPLPVAADGARDFITVQWEWSGATLFVAPYAPGDARYRRLAASVDGRPFAWVEQHGLLADAGDDASIVGLVGTSAALYVVIYGEPCASTCRHTMRSADAGASWSRFAPTYQGAAVALVPSSSDRALFGHVFEVASAQATGENYVRALADSAGWDSLPAPPGNLAIGRVWDLPDARLYAALDHFATASLISPGLYTLAPDGASWAFVASYPAGGPQSLAISWDEHGHALALWGAANSFLPDRLTGLETFAL